MNEAEQDSSNQASFEQALRRLEEIVAALENDSMDLEHALAHYEEGVRLAQHCMDRLNTAELRIREMPLEE